MLKYTVRRRRRLGDEMHTARLDVQYILRASQKVLRELGEMHVEVRKSLHTSCDCKATNCRSDQIFFRETAWPTSARRADDLRSPERNIDKAGEQEPYRWNEYNVHHDNDEHRDQYACKISGRCCKGIFDAYRFGLVGPFARIV
jgi:hypothetical protein